MVLILGVSIVVSAAIALPLRPETMMAVMKWTDTSQPKPFLWALPVKPNRVLPLYCVAYSVNTSTANPMPLPAR